MPIEPSKPPIRPDPYSSLELAIEYLMREASSLGLNNVVRALERAISVLRESR